MAEANTQQVGEEEDQSMEEILQSIRRIIAEEDEEDESANAETKGEGGNTPMAEEKEEAPGSDILELTEVIEEEESVEEETVEEPEVEAVEEPETGDIDILKNIDAALGSSEPEPVAKPKSKATPKKKAAAPPVKEKDSDSLLSERTATSAAQVLKTVRPPEPKTVDGLSFRDGTTVEDLVKEALKPMLKVWLDDNLTTIVERIVEKEVKKLSE